jgi:hypothetical protein
MFYSNLSEKQSRFCPVCGQPNDYNTITCTYCLSPLEESRNSDESSDKAVKTPSSVSGLTDKDLQELVRKEHAQMVKDTSLKPNARLLLVALVLIPLLLLTFFALFGALASLTEVQRLAR